MQSATLGKTGLLVSRLGVGGSAFGGGLFHRDDRETLALLDEGIGRGINFIDTSDNYSMGRSEALIGRAVRGRRAGLVIATKGGACFTKTGRLALAARPVIRPLRPLLAPWRRWLNLQRDRHKRYAYDAASLRRALEASLRRLGTDYVDVYQLYNPTPASGGLEEAFEFLERAKSEGKARAIGITVNHVEDALGILGRWTPDTIQFPMSMLDRSAREQLLPRCARDGIGLIARSVLAQGLLTDARGHVMADESSHIDLEKLARWRTECDALRVLVRPGRTLAQAATRYVWQQREVAVVLVGVVGSEQLRECLGAASALPLDVGDMARIEEISKGI